MISHEKHRIHSFVVLPRPIHRKVPKAGLSGNLLDERWVRKEKVEATADSIAPPVPLGDVAEGGVDGEGGTLLLDELPGGNDRRRLGKYDKSPGDADMTMTAYAGHGGRENKKGGRKKKRERGQKKKKKRNNNGKATRQGGPRKRFGVTGGDVAGGKARKRP
jgi:hypothetical protein